jgi:hypothetical protein
MPAGRAASPTPYPLTMFPRARLVKLFMVRAVTQRTGDKSSHKRDIRREFSALVVRARSMSRPPTSADQTRCPGAVNGWMTRLPRVARPRANRAKGIASAVLETAMRIMAANIRGEMVPPSKRTVRTISSVRPLACRRDPRPSPNDHLSPISRAATAVPSMMPIAPTPTEMPKNCSRAGNSDR